MLLVAGIHFIPSLFSRRPSVSGLTLCTSKDWATVCRVRYHTARYAPPRTLLRLLIAKREQVSGVSATPWISRCPRLVPRRSKNSGFSPSRAQRSPSAPGTARRTPSCRTAAVPGGCRSKNAWSACAASGRPSAVAGGRLLPDRPGTRKALRIPVVPPLGRNSSLYVGIWPPISRRMQPMTFPYPYAGPNLSPGTEGPLSTYESVNPTRRVGLGHCEDRIVVRDLQLSRGPPRLTSAIGLPPAHAAPHRRGPGAPPGTVV